MKNLKSATYSAQQIQNMIDQKYLLISYKYQREYIWNSRFKKELIISLFKGWPIGSFIFRDCGDDKQEIVDGQQRILTILEFINDKLSLNSTHSQEATQILLEKNNNNERKKFYSNKVIKRFSQLMEIDKTDFLSGNIISAQQISGNEEEIKKYFTLVQNQEKVKAGEIITNMPNLPIDELIDSDFIEILNTNIKWNDNRKELTKLIIGNLGYKYNYLNIGASDEEIINFAKKISDNEINLNNEENLLIKKNIYFLKRLNFKIDVTKAKKRFIKLFLLLTNDINENSKLDILKIADLNNLLTKYNSKKIRVEKNKEEIKENFINDLIKNNFIKDKDEYEKYFEELFFIFQGSKNINSTENINLIKFWQSKLIN